MTTLLANTSDQNIHSSVRDIFAQVTRYPLEILDPQARLEEELGIDSVKLGEVFAVLREHYGLPERLDVPREQLKTIAGIADALGVFARTQDVAATAPPQTHHANGHAAKADSNLEASVRAVFAQVTRYPLDILDPQARLEEELGIDSVKLGEVFAVLREQYRLPERPNIPREQLKTIAGIAAALAAFMHTPQPRSAPEPPQTVKPNGKLNGHAAPAAAEKPGADGDAADLAANVRAVFAQVTRYPPEILDPDALLEEELGIDSVKLGEVFAVLREQYRLPERPNIPREQLKTIAGIAAALAAFMHTPQPRSAPEPPQTVKPNGKLNGHAAPAAAEKPGADGDAADLAANVRAVFAQVTRYPPEILDPDALLEEELGIDSVKLGEVFAVLRERYGLPEKLDIPRAELKTIAGAAGALARYLKQGEMAPSQARAAEEISPAVTRPAAVPGASAGSFAHLVPELKPFAGKIALVTGSGRGLGKDVACYLASLGATVIVNSFHSRPQGEATVEEIAAAGGTAIHAWGSVANPDHVAAIFDQIETVYGGLDFFVSNASNGMLARLKEITVEHWQKAFHTNVIGLHQTAMAAAALMKKRGGGKIITMSSPASHGYVDYFGCMGAVKASVESLTKSLAIELSVDNIQVNCVSPGPIYGELLDRWPESERLIAKWEDATVYNRLCEARDVSHFVAYLLSDAVKLFAGSVLVMDGGISVRWG